MRSFQALESAIASLAAFPERRPLLPGMAAFLFEFAISSTVASRICIDSCSPSKVKPCTFFRSVTGDVSPSLRISQNVAAPVPTDGRGSHRC